MNLFTTSVEEYSENGYSIIKGFASQEQVSELKNSMRELLPKIAKEQYSVFSTTRQQATSDKYFLDSGDKIRCFYEDFEINEGEFPPINKVGHALHDLHESFQRFSYQEKIKNLAKALGLKTPAIIQSQYIFKESGVGGEVRPHNDSTFIYTRPLSCLGLWLALDPANTENGCLWGLEGSHLEPQLEKRFVRNADGKSTSFIPMGDQKLEWDLDKGTPLQAEPGDLVILHGSFVHWSFVNRSPHSRNAYVLHLIDREAEYPSSNWLQRTSENPLRNL